MTAMNSCNSRQTHTLAVTSAKAEEFVRHVANLPDELRTLSRLKRFVDLLPNPHDLYLNFFELESTGSEVTSCRKLERAEVESRFCVDWLLPFRDQLRAIWLTPDWRQREWRVFKLREAAASPPVAASSALIWWQTPPEMKPVDLVLLHLLKAAERARYCANPDCPAPYFFATRRSQKYCSNNCASPAQSEFKRRWWAERGREWRAGRKAKAASKKAQRKRGK